MFRQSIACLLLAMLNVSLAQNYPPGVPVPRTQGEEIRFHEPAGQPAVQPQPPVGQPDFQGQQGPPGQPVRQYEQAPPAPQAQPQYNPGQGQPNYQPPDSKPEYRSRTGPPAMRHTNIHFNMEEEREHLKSHIKEEYIDKEKLDDSALLMQYFKKHDTDGNLRLDGLELLKSIARLSHEDHDHEDEEDVGEGARAPPPREPLDLEKLTEVVDQILEQDDKNQDGYITWAEFLLRQRGNH